MEFKLGSLFMFQNLSQFISVSRNCVWVLNIKAVSVIHIDIVFVLKLVKYKHEMINILLGGKEEVCVHHPAPPPQSHQLRWIVIGLLALVLLYSSVIITVYIRLRVTICVSDLLSIWQLVVECNQVLLLYLSILYTLYILK